MTAFAELLDNSLDEVSSTVTSHLQYLYYFPEISEIIFCCRCVICYQVYNGATYVNIDMLLNKKDQNRMLLIEGFVFVRICI